MALCVLVLESKVRRTLNLDAKKTENSRTYISQSNSFDLQFKLQISVYKRDLGNFENKNDDVVGDIIGVVG